METGNKKHNLRRLLEKGVRIPCPESVEIGPDVDPRRISGERVTVHAGCRIYGAKTLIMPGVELGYEGAATVHNCQLGKNVKLKGGFFSESCFLEGASLASGAQIREACLLEERARVAHTVGLKHTILFPFVALGSLINLCDCLMAGGTDEENHSEVGSSYVHFNYTPNQDKATASLIGDVPKGVMIDQRPIFLGGHGGLVGPVRIGYGTVVAAGTIVRKDILKENTILFGNQSLSKAMPFYPGLYSSIKRLVTVNTIYISNLMALRTWYLCVRSRFMKDGPMESALLEGAVNKLDMAVVEKIKRLREVANRMPRSIEIYNRITSGRVQQKAIQRKQEFCEKWADIERVFSESLELEGELSQKQAFSDIIDRAISRKGSNYLPVIKGLTETESLVGTAWLQGLVNEITNNVLGILPSFGTKGL